MKKHKLNLFAKPSDIQLISAVIILIVLSVVIVVSLGKALRNMDYFKINDVMVSQGNTMDLSYLKGRNIWALDLQEEARYINQLYPDSQQVRLVRVLPNRLFVDVLRRRPLALVRLYKIFCVDENAVIFDSPSPTQDLDLPFILGLESKIPGPKSGRLYNLRELVLSLNIIKEVKLNRLLKDYHIKAIDTKNPGWVSLFIFLPAQSADYSKAESNTERAALEIKMGYDDVKSRVNILGTLLPQLKNDLSRIKYIDLRFKEPVIKFNDAKS